MENELSQRIRLILDSAVNMTEDERIELTTSCRDTDYIQKVKNAGEIINCCNQKLQIMHNGLKVIAGGYGGNWTCRIIESLRGHHEPQEEKVFHELLKYYDEGSIMIELGSFWAYYSLWFNSFVKNALNYCIEPNESSMQVGKENFRINNRKRVKFIQASIDGTDNRKVNFFLEKDQSITKIYTLGIDGFVKRNLIPKIDLLHIDIQGQEYNALLSARKTILEKRIRFVFISTHHWMISHDFLTHQKCREFLLKMGAHIISEFNVLESYSGDGLLVASFDVRDRELNIEVSRNNSQRSLFRAYEKDLSHLLALESLLELAESRCVDISNQLDIISNSRSWRFTKPLRLLEKLVRSNNAN